jgi:SAM-dependent methyltransferase
MVSGSPTGYEDEPREVFENIPPEVHSRLYHYERLHQDLAAEINYYRGHLGGSCENVLDLGCGTGLLAAGLVEQGISVTSIDIDAAMLYQASVTGAGRLIRMDMCALGFRPSCFEGAVIAQNTLNLLVERPKIQRCLEEIRRILTPPGLILAHLHCLEPDQIHESDYRLMQFQMFDHPEGGKIIKETIRSFDIEKNALKLEQRYKIRRFDPALEDRNYCTRSYLAVLGRKQWEQIFQAAGFSVETTFSDFSGNRTGSTSSLHIVGRLRQS